MANPSVGVIVNENVTISDGTTAANQLKVNSDGSINTTAAVSVKSTTVTTTQVSVPSTANGILILAANTARLGALITNPSTVTVYWSQQSSGLTISNGTALPAGQTLSIDQSPLYTGAIYGIVAASSQTVTTAEFTA